MRLLQEGGLHLLRSRGTGLGGVGRDGMRRDGMRRDGTGRVGAGRDGTGWGFGRFDGEIVLDKFSAVHSHGQRVG